jgi:RNA polymerase sigma factor (sigma-70 family)
MSEPDHADDADLVAGCRQGDAAAWEALVNRYQRLVYAIALRAGADEHGAADVFQTVFVRLLAHVQRLAQPDRLQAWIVTTAKREALRLRQVGRRTVSLTPIEGDDAMPLEDTLPDDSPLAEQALAELQQLELLRRGLDRLDERCRSTAAPAVPRRRRAGGLRERRARARDSRGQHRPDALALPWQAAPAGRTKSGQWLSAMYLMTA